MLHLLPVDHRFHRQAHGTILNAGMTVAALLGFGLQLKGRPAKSISYFSADDHELGHPAEVVAKGSLPEYKGRKDDEDQKDDVIGDQGLKIPNGQSVARLVEKIDGMITAGHNSNHNNCTDPRYPNPPLDRIAFCDAFIPGLEDGLLAPAGRT